MASAAPGVPTRSHRRAQRTQSTLMSVYAVRRQRSHPLQERHAKCCRAMAAVARATRRVAGAPHPLPLRGSVQWHRRSWPLGGARARESATHGRCSARRSPTSRTSHQDGLKSWLLDRRKALRRLYKTARLEYFKSLRAISLRKCRSSGKAGRNCNQWRHQRACHVGVALPSLRSGKPTPHR